MKAISKLLVQSKALDKLTTLKTLETKYQKRSQIDLLAKIDQRLAVRAEKAVDGLFFTTVEGENTDDGLVRVETSQLQQFDFQGQSDRRFTFDSDSLALKALQEGSVDFKDARVNFTAAKVDLAHSNLLEVDLGTLNSLPSGQIHVDEKRRAAAGEQIVDSDSKFRLVMVGRKVSATEVGSQEEQHQISSQVFHESNEAFSQGIKRDEGTIKHFARHFYMPFLMLGAVGLWLAIYQESQKILSSYEDYLDWLVFQLVKKGYRLEKVATVLYKSDAYSVENRTN